MVHFYDLERIGRFDITWSCPLKGRPPFSRLAVYTQAHIPLYTSEQTSPMALSANSVVGATDPLVTTL